MPQLDPTWYASQSFWMLVTFCAMFLMMWRFVMPAMRATVDARRSRIETDIQKTEELKNEASRLLKDLTQAQEDVKRKMQAAFAQAQAEAQALTQQLEIDFNARLSAQIAEKEQALETAKEIALQDVARISGDLAAAIVPKIAGITVSADEIHQTITSVMEERA
jgi:F-type H+-transporting ATPase subunit b